MNSSNFNPNFDGFKGANLEPLLKQKAYRDYKIINAAMKVEKNAKCSYDKDTSELTISPLKGKEIKIKLSELSQSPDRWTLSRLSHNIKMFFSTSYENDFNKRISRLAQNIVISMDEMETNPDNELEVLDSSKPPIIAGEEEEKIIAGEEEEKMQEVLSEHSSTYSVEEPVGLGKNEVDHVSIPSNTLVSKEDGQKVFWGLGEQFWKQIMDGKYHQYGPQVFDEGLHQGSVEPGYFASVKRGCEFASENLGQTLSISFYKDLHKTLCAHFKGKENETLIAATETGKFLKNTASIFHDFRKDSEVIDEKLALVHDVEFKLNTKLGQNIVKKGMDADEKVLWEKDLAAYPETKAWCDAWKDNIVNHHKNLKEEMSSRFEELGIEPFAWIVLISRDHMNELTAYKVIYDSLNEQQVEEIVILLFDRYNRAIDASKQGDGDVVTAIADLFQMLEWLHPFTDGQGRTDLVLLNKLLVDQGLNPVILKEPFVSSWSNLEEWKKALEEGMANWRSAQEEISI